MTNDEYLTLWEKSMNDFLIHDIRIALDQNSLRAGVLILSLVAVDCLGGYYTGNLSKTNTFKEFLESRYFPPKYKEHKNLIWDDLRNALFHDYSFTDIKIDLFGTSQEANDLKHLQKTASGKVCFFCDVFAQDVLIAWDKFSKDVRENEGDVQKKVIQRIKKTKEKRSGEKMSRAFLILKRDKSLNTNESFPFSNNENAGTATMSSSNYEDFIG